MIMERKKSANDIVAQWKRIANNPYAVPTTPFNANRRSRAYAAFNRYYQNIVKFGGFADTKFTRVQYMGI